jgi:26S proteasome regulatory subunit N8
MTEEVKEVVVHPLVLLSVVDHYNRVAKDSKRRVVGVMLGESYKGRVDVTNSFAGMGAVFLLFVFFSQ